MAVVGGAAAFWRARGDFASAGVRGGADAAFVASRHGIIPVPTHTALAASSSMRPALLVRVADAQTRSLITGSAATSLLATAAAVRRDTRRRGPRRSGWSEARRGVDMRQELVAELRSRAAEVRQEAAVLEASLSAERGLKRQQIFHQMRAMGPAHTRTVSSLQLFLGAPMLLNLDLTLLEAEQLVHLHDIDRDGALHVDEFVHGCDGFNMDLHRIRSQEHDSELILERAQRQADKVQATRRERIAHRREIFDNMPKPNLDESFASRGLAVAAYLLPVLDMLRFFAPVVLSDAGLDGFAQVVKFAQWPILIAMSICANRWSVPQLIRFNLSQAYILDVLMSISQFVLFVVGLIPSLGPEWAGSFNDPLLFSFAGAIAYSVLATACGESPRHLPFVSAEASRALGSIRRHDGAEPSLEVARALVGDEIEVPLELVGDVHREKFWVKMVSFLCYLGFAVALLGYYCLLAGSLYQAVFAQEIYPEITLADPM
mmetsp:Transcript_148756/g.477754  ORF Transcript_148756/g.477754 Transcript_148756/m.477754 type:complete len:489 (-) Transcript_148756:237-1703(-)